MTVVTQRASRVAWACIYALGALLVAHFFLHFSGTVFSTLDYYPKANLERMMDQSADKPYVGRMLVPFILHAADQATPGDAQQAIGSVFISKGLFSDFEATEYARNGVFPFRVAVYIVLCLGLFFLIAVGGKAAYEAAYSVGGFQSKLAGLIYLLAIPLWFRYIAYIYDPMTLCLGTWLVYSVLRRKHWLTVVLFVLACINKETAPIYLPFIVFSSVHKYRGDRKSDALNLSILIGVVLLVVAGLIETFRRSYFAGNPSSWTEFHLLDHQLVVIPEYGWSLLYAAVVMFAFLFLAGRNWKSKPLDLRVGMISVIVPLFVASIFFGFVDEIRALFDAWPFVLLLGIPTLFQILGVPDSPVDIRAVAEASR